MDTFLVRPLSTQFSCDHIQNGGQTTGRLNGMEWQRSKFSGVRKLPRYIGLLHDGLR